MATVASFLAAFPADLEIQARDEDYINQTLSMVITETCGYEGILDAATRELAINLHTAHYIKQEILAETPMGRFGVPKAISSKDDKIEYSASQGFGFESTVYGSRLARLIDSLYLGGFSA